jgi:hypothetical protein
MSIADLCNGDQGVLTTEQLNEKQFNVQLGELAVQWQNARETDLEIRHQTGALLNKRYGSPEKRLTRGKEIMLEVAGQLQVAQSELSRMRRFAFHFTSAEDMRQKYPDVVNWTAVKVLLTTLKPQGKAKGQTNNGVAGSSSSRVPNTRKLKKIQHLLDALPSDVREIQTDLTDDQKKELRAKFDVVATAFNDCLKVSVGQDELSSEMAPLAQMTD